MNRRRTVQFVACLIVACTVVPARLDAQATPALWRGFVEKLDPGKTLKVRLKTGERFKATLLQVGPEGMMLQPKTRVAVPPQHVPFDAVETLEIDEARGVGIGKAVAIGAGVAAGAWLALMAMTFAIWGD